MSRKNNSKCILPSYSLFTFNHRKVKLADVLPKPPPPDWMSLLFTHLEVAETSANDEQMERIAEAIRNFSDKMQEKLLHNRPKLAAVVQKERVPTFYGMKSFGYMMRCADYRKRQDIVGKVVTALWEVNNEMIKQQTSYLERNESCG